MYLYNEDMTTAYVFKSLADNTRLAIIRKLASEDGDVPCKNIINDCSLALNLSQPTMSHHLAKLVQSGVIIERKQGKEKFYALNRALLFTSGIDASKL